MRGFKYFTSNVFLTLTQIDELTNVFGIQRIETYRVTIRSILKCSYKLYIISKCISIVYSPKFPVICIKLRRIYCQIIERYDVTAKVQAQ